MNIKKKFVDFMLEPAKGIQSSQTLYEALLATLNMYMATQDDEWRKSAEYISQKIVDSQLEDGGFDIGYNFRFGENIKKSSKIQATTPECLSVYALIEYYKLFKNEEIKKSIDKGICWIKKNSFVNENGFWVIPYAPKTIQDVYITNAISFCIGTIANYIYTFDKKEYLEMYQGMCDYMLSQITINGEEGYWTYFEKKLVGKSVLYSKVDNYHIAQQLFYHIQAQNMCPYDSNQKIIEYVMEYLDNRLKKNVVVPYICIKGEVSDIADIDMWGYCALLMCVVKRYDMENARKIVEIILEKSWNGEYFSPVLNRALEIVDNRFYPRSDAWVVHALSEFFLVERALEVEDVIKKSLKKLRDCDYSGVENHALTPKKELLAIVAKMYRSLLRKK